MSHKYEHISTGKGFKVLNSGVEKQVINQEGLVTADVKADSATILTDSSGDLLMVQGTTLPGSVAGYAKGCLFIDTDVASGTSGLYVNIGTKTVASFKLVTNA